jgi:hypothetical protein
VYLFSKNNPLEIDIRLLPIEKMSSLYAPHPVVGKQVEESLVRDGLLNPIVVVPRSVMGEKLTYYVENHHVDGPDAEFFVYTGNNRYSAALNLGYRFIEAYICPDLAFLTSWEEKIQMNPREYAA